MEATESVYFSSEAVSEIFCEPCGRSENESEKTTAEWFCDDCSEYLCGKCLKYHKKFKHFENHVLLDKDHMPLDPKQVKSKDICMSKCQVHVDVSRVIEYVCMECDKIGCQVCMTIDHQSCKNKKYIPNEVKNSETSEEVNEFSKKLESMDVDLQGLHDKTSKHYKLSENMNKQALKDLDQHKGRIDTFFENMYDKIKKDIQDNKNEDSKVYNDCLSEIKSLQTDLHKNKTRLNALEQGCQKCELFIFMKVNKTTLEKMSTDIVKLSKTVKEKTVKYEPSSVVQEVMKEEIKVLGRLVIGEADHKSQTNVESVRKTMEKELNLLRRENEDFKNKLLKIKVLNEGLEQDKIKQNALVEKVKQENVVLDTKYASLKLEYDKSVATNKEELRKLKDELHQKEEGLRNLEEIFCQKEEGEVKLKKELRILKEKLCQREEEFRQKEESEVKLKKELRILKEKEDKLEEELHKHEAKSCEQCQREAIKKEEEELRKWREELRKLEEELHKTEEERPKTEEERPKTVLGKIQELMKREKK